MEEVNCPVEHCKDCEFHRTESWCAQAIPINQSVYDEKYRAYMEGFWEALDWAEEHYKSMEEFYDKINNYIASMEKLIDLWYADGRPPTAEEVAEIDNYWNGDE